VLSTHVALINTYVAVGSCPGVNDVSVSGEPDGDVAHDENGAETGTSGAVDCLHGVLAATGASNSGIFFLQKKTHNQQCTTYIFFSHM
jgi:hypothetical protein